MTQVKESQVVVSGVITDTQLNSNILNMIRPVATIEVFDPVHKEWVKDIYIIFSENGDARRFKGLNTGDLIMVTGELSFITGTGYVIYATEHTILCKNKNGTPQKNRIVLFDGCNQQNFIYIKGKVTTFNEDNRVATITHHIASNIRGDLIKESTYPVFVTNSVTPEYTDCIFTGHFAKHHIEGELYTIYQS